MVLCKSTVQPENLSSVLAILFLCIDVRTLYDGTHLSVTLLVRCHTTVPRLRHIAFTSILYSAWALSVPISVITRKVISQTVHRTLSTYLHCVQALHLYCGLRGLYRRYQLYRGRTCFPIRIVIVKLNFPFPKHNFSGPGGNRTHYSDIASVTRLPLEHASPYSLCLRT